MKFEEALEQFRAEIVKQYGFVDSIVKIGITPQLMDKVVFETFAKERTNFSYGTACFNPSMFGEFHLFGIQILPREKDEF